MANAHEHRGDGEYNPCPGCTDEWMAASTIPDLARLGARWLTGDLEWQPRYTSSVPDPETALILEPLVALNNAGVWTDQSQPGAIDSPREKQRAFVTGYCTEETAEAITAAVVGTDLVALAAPCMLDSSFQVPVTIDDGAPFTWVGGGGTPVDEYIGEVSMEAVRAMSRGWSVEVFDPRWGRNDLLWDTLVRAVHT